MAEPSPEQIREFQEKLKSMSPEELREFQKQQCIFCKIISGEVQSKKIYEDKHCIAILDINPANPGHLLLMPRDHYSLMPLVPPDTLSHLAMVSKALSHVMLNHLNADGTNIFVANGTAAGQRAQHFMIHVIPRKEGDGVPLAIPEVKISEEDVEDLRQKMLPFVEKLLAQGKKVVAVGRESAEGEKEGFVEEKQEEKKAEEETEKGIGEEKESEEGTEEAEKQAKEEDKEEKWSEVKKAKKSEVSLDDIAELFK